MWGQNSSLRWKSFCYFCSQNAFGSLSRRHSWKAKGCVGFIVFINVLSKQLRDILLDTWIWGSQVQTTLSFTNTENVKQSRCTFYFFPLSLLLCFWEIKIYFCNSSEHCLFRHKIQIIYIYFCYDCKHSSTFRTLYSHEKLPYQEALETSTNSRNNLCLYFCAEGTPQLWTVSLRLSRGWFKGLLDPNVWIPMESAGAVGAWHSGTWSCCSWEPVLLLRR